MAPLVCADAHNVNLWQNKGTKLWCTFALPAVPPAWLRALTDGDELLAPIGSAERQQLTKVSKSAGKVIVKTIGDVRFVSDRGQAATPAPRH